MVWASFTCFHIFDEPCLQNIRFLPRKKGHFRHCACIWPNWWIQNFLQISLKASNFLMKVILIIWKLRQFLFWYKGMYSFKVLVLFIFCCDTLYHFSFNKILFLVSWFLWNTSASTNADITHRPNDQNWRGTTLKCYSFPLLFFFFKNLSDVEGIYIERSIMGQRVYKSITWIWTWHFKWRRHGIWSVFLWIEVWRGFHLLWRYYLWD